MLILHSQAKDWKIKVLKKIKKKQPLKCFYQICVNIRKISVQEMYVINSIGGSRLPNQIKEALTI